MIKKMIKRKKTKNKTIKTLLLLSCLFCLTSCKKEEVSDETTEVPLTEYSEDQTSNDNGDDILISGQNEEDIYEEAVEDTEETEEENEEQSVKKEKLPDVIEPLNDHSLFDPTITNASILDPNHYNRTRLLLDIRKFMKSYEMFDAECSEIRFTEKIAQKIYKATLITDQGNIDIIINKVNKNYYITADEDPGSSEFVLATNTDAQ